MPRADTHIATVGSICRQVLVARGVPVSRVLRSPRASRNHQRLKISLDRQRPQRNQRFQRRATPDEKPVWDISGVPGRQNQMLAAMTSIRTRNAHVHHPTLMMVVDQSDERSGRKLNHTRPPRKPNPAGAIWRVGVEREADLSRTG
jgi:hypothetical protein